MNTKAETSTQPGVLNGVLWLLVIALLVAGVGGNWYFAEESILYRALALTALAVVAASLGFQTTQGKALWTLLREARVEIRRVVWPNRQETIQTTFIVVALVFIVALILWVLDLGLGWIVSRVIG